MVDTNIIISSLLKETGYTRRALILFSELYPTYTTEYALEEIKRHTQTLSRRKGLSWEKLRVLLELVISSIEIAGLEAFRKYVDEAQRMVLDLGDVDFAALALKLRENYHRVIILTWNKKDYDQKRLGRNEIVGSRLQKL